MVKDGRKPGDQGIYKCYLEVQRNGSENREGDVNTKPYTFGPFVCNGYKTIYRFDKDSLRLG